jgi:hypothetical protein
VTTFPELDEHGTPTAKLPDCPQCGDDELGVVSRDCVLCYRCGWEFWRPEAKAVLRDIALWIRRRLETLEHRSVTDERGRYVNGFAFSAVPDWELRQKLEAIDEDLAGAATTAPCQPQAKPS